MNNREEFLQRLDNSCIQNKEKIAIKDNLRSINYEELRKKTNCLANIIRNTVGYKTRAIGVELERSIEWVIVFLAVLKAGYIYLPIDKNIPKQRKEYMLSNANAKVLITDCDSNEYSECLININKINLNIANTYIQDFNVVENISYIIYTSGTTGQPKGVMINYSGMLNHLKSKISLMSIKNDCKLMQLASECFDISIWQVIVPLLVGGEVHIISKKRQSNLRELSDYVLENRINIIEVVPSYFNKIVFSNEEIRNKFDRIKYILLTGEKPSVQMCKQWYEKTNYSVLVNAYGPTECSDDVTHYVIDRSYKFDKNTVPIGYGIDNVILKVIAIGADINSNDLGNYEKGELVVSGICVGNGYVNDEKSTKNNFEINKKGEVFYRTGDLVSKDQNGCFYFWGRIDRQIKHKGYRVETQEIEEKTRKIKGVLECYVTVKEKKYSRVYYLENEDNSVNISTKKFLVSYVVLNETEDQERFVAKIQAALKEELPEYMLPDCIICLKELPLTENGKVNEKELPLPVERNTNEYVAPMGKIEKKVAKIWENCLNIAPIGRKDNFSDFGDSLSYMEMLAEIEEALGLSIPYYHMTSSRNLEEFCRNLHPIERHIIPRISEMNTYNTSFAEKGQYFLWKMDPDNTYYTFQGIITIRGNIDVERFSGVIDKIFKEHQILRCNYFFDKKSKQIKKKINGYCKTNLEYIDLSLYDELTIKKKIRDIAREISRKSFDLEKDVLFKLKLFMCSKNMYVLLCTTHEVIMDAWSMYKFIDEIQKLYYMDDISYFAYTNPYQYHDFAEWEQLQKKDLFFLECKNYWDKRLSGELPVLNISLANRRKNIVSNQSDNIVYIIDKNKYLLLKKFIREKNCSLFKVLMSVYFLTLYLLSGQDDIIVGTPYASRDMKEITNLYGCFLNMLPIRMSLNSSMKLGDILSRTGKLIDEAISYSKYPFMNMVNDKHFNRAKNVTPIFQVMFDMVNFPVIDFYDDNLVMNFQEIDLNVKKYDLNLYAFEQNDELYLKLAYLTDLYTKSGSEKIMKYYKYLLDEMVRDSTTNIKELQVILEETKNDKLSKSYENIEELVEKLFSNQKIDDNAILYRDSNSSITYEKLKEEIAENSKLFKQKGIKKGEIVIVFSDKDIRTILNILTLFKCEITYVPIDAFFSINQLDEIITKIKPNWIISDKKLNYQNEEKINDKYFYSVFKDVEYDYSKIACIIKTSASSGKQKYVLISRKSFINRIYDTNNLDIEISSFRTMISLRSIALVTHIFELFTNLVHGKVNILCKRNETLNTKYIIYLLEQNSVEYIVLAPPLLRMLINEYKRQNKKNKNTKAVLSGSSKLDKKTICDFHNVFENANLYNTYGATETSSTCYFEKLDKMGNVLDGETINGSKIYIIDENGNEMINGVEGEIVVEGDCVAEGYYNLDLDNFKKSGNRRLYYTGDVGKIDEKGNLIVIGRRDRIVKCRGYKIDFNEIENICRMISGVKDCVCVLEDREERYALFYTKMEQAEICESDIIGMLRIKFPNYMLPQYVIELDELPCTLSGKIVYGGLKELLNLYRTNHSNENLSELEKKILKVYSKVLKLENIGVNDNFFLIGGNSLLAIELVMLLEEEYGYKIMISDLYDGSSSVAEVAKIVENSVNLN